MSIPAGCPVCAQGEGEFLCKVRLHAGSDWDVRGCSRCGAAYCWPIPPLEHIARCYPPSYHTEFLRQYWKDYYKGRVLGLELSRWRESGRALDVGCALGTMLAGLRDHSRWSVRGLEFSEGAAELGRSVNRLEIETAPLARAPWPDGSFDFVHVNNVLEHEAAPEAALKRAAGLLAPGGRLGLTVPNGPVDLMPSLELFRRLGRPAFTRHSGHLFFFSRKSLELLLARCGFRVLRLRGFHIKLGLKARGWLPGGRRGLLERPEAPPPPPAPQDAAARLPPRPSWPLYRLRSALRRLWRFPNCDLGYDFDILAEKK